jgi:hypothetical protein
MEMGSLRLRIFRLVFGTVFTVLGIWMSAKVVLQLQSVNAAWPDWLFLLLPSPVLALGLFSLVAAARNYPDLRRSFLRERSGAARVFGSVTFGFYMISGLLQRLFQQKTLAGILYELSAAALVVGLLALLFGAINADLRDQEHHSLK